MINPQDNDTKRIAIRDVKVSTYQKIKILAAVECKSIAEAIEILVDNYEEHNGEID